MTASGWVRWRSGTLCVSDFSAQPVHVELGVCVAHQPAPALSAATKKRRSSSWVRPRPVCQVLVGVRPVTSGRTVLRSPTLSALDAFGARTAYPPTPTTVAL